MKSWFSKKSNLFLILILAFALFRQFPALVNNLQQENKFIEPKNVLLIENDREVQFPPKDSRAVAIFWATWCGPCKIEMERLKSSVNSGAISKEAIFAINPFETQMTIKEFLLNNSYPFTFIQYSSLGRDLDISVTPTTIFFDKGNIKSMSSGMSILGIWKAEFFL